MTDYRARNKGKDCGYRTEIDDGNGSKRAIGQGLGTHATEHGLIGLPVPHYVHFQIEGTKQIRATRVAELDELAKAIGALDTDIGRLVQGMPALFSYDFDIERLGREKAALAELQKRAGRNGCPGSTTVIESLFPDIPVKKKTASEKAEIERWLAIRKEAGVKIDPETAEVDWDYGNTLTRMGSGTNGKSRKNSRSSGVSDGRVLQEAISGFISTICPTLSEKRFGQSITPGLISPRA